jgi:hypothetical protein
MQFSNSAGTGILEKLELRMTTSCPSGKVRLGIYADFNDKPGNRLLDAGETTVDDGWMVCVRPASAGDCR